MLAAAVSPEERSCGTLTLLHPGSAVPPLLCISLHCTAPFPSLRVSGVAARRGAAALRPEQHCALCLSRSLRSQGLPRGVCKFVNGGRAPALPGAPVATRVHELCRRPAMTQRALSVRWVQSSTSAGSTPRRRRQWTRRRRPPCGCGSWRLCMRASRRQSPHTAARRRPRSETRPTSGSTRLALAPPYTDLSNYINYDNPGHSLVEHRTNYQALSAPALLSTPTLLI